MSSPAALLAAAQYVEAAFADIGFTASRQAFSFAGSEYFNVVAIRPGSDPARPRVLVGAHYDSVRGTPGADDNASGVAGLLEVGRVLQETELAATVELVAFNLEELQGRRLTYRVGSRHYAAAARRNGVRYAGALVLEMLGYVERGKPVAPLLLFWKRLPSDASFIAATGDWKSRRLLREFAHAARLAAPSLPVVTFRSPFRGWVIPHTRLSDNASFWDQGYPSLMITDTAFLRNPHYHRRSDTADTLDFQFMARVVDAVAATVVRLSQDDEGRAPTSSQAGRLPFG